MTRIEIENMIYEAKNKLISAKAQFKHRCSVDEFYSSKKDDLRESEKLDIVIKLLDL